jgi:dipeptidyl aminopeptidase/acylaminoacyl peptidase
LKKLGYTKIGLMGSSFGGISSIMAASKTNDLFVLALKSPVSNFEEKEIMTKTKKELEEWKRKGYKYYISGDGRKLRLNYTFAEDSKNNNGYQAARKIKIPTLIVHGDKDKSVPIEQSKKTANLIKECKLEIIKGADHEYSKPKDREKMLFLISDFLIKNSI